MVLREQGESIQLIQNLKLELVFEQAISSLDFYTLINYNLIISSKRIPFKTAKVFFFIECIWVLE